LRALTDPNSKEVRQAARHFGKLLEQTQIACYGSNEEQAIRIRQWFRFSCCADRAGPFDKRLL
jgi:hypothetical protein